MASSTTQGVPTSLSPLLDVSALETPAQISLRFRDIAEAILYDHRLCIEHQGQSTHFELLEIEFYLLKTNVHEDPFCHADDEQRHSGKWHFHRAPKNTASSVQVSRAPTDAAGYRGGTRKGLDLTFGTPITSPFFPTPQEASTHCRGGILFRSVRQIGGGRTIISGPSLLVDKILSITKSRNIAELVGTKLGGCISAFLASNDSTALSATQSRIYLYTCPRMPAASLAMIHQSPRIGLDLSHPTASPQPSNSRVIYISKLYRYFVCPQLLKANGRCHTLIGLYLEQAATVPATGSLKDQSALRTRLTEIMALSRATVDKYMDEYAEGCAKTSLAAYVGSAGKGASSNPKTFMRMMGVLRRMELLKVDG